MEETVKTQDKHVQDDVEAIAEANLPSVATVGEEERKPAYYSIITAAVRYDNAISPSAKLLYSEITALSNEKGFCWATNVYFSKLYGVNKGTVSRWMSELEGAGHIKSFLAKSEKGETIRKIFITNGLKIDFSAVGTGEDKKDEDKNGELPEKSNRGSASGVLGTKIDIFVGDMPSWWPEVLLATDGVSVEPKMSVFDVCKVILAKWNSKPSLRKHSEGYIEKGKCGKRFFFREVVEIVKSDGLPKVLRAIDFYYEILSSPEYWWTYQWPLADFICRGYEKFKLEAEESARKNYRKTKTGDRRDWTPRQYDGDEF